MKVLFISYVDVASNDSGSGVRPARMLSAFKAAGHEVTALTGSQTAPERKKHVSEIAGLLDTASFDLCYIESPVYPIMQRADRKLIRKIHKKGIPTGYFYRDFYRKFPDLFPRRKGFVNSLKELYLDILQILTDKVLENCDIVYFPSIQAEKLFSYKNMKALPPAGENNLPTAYSFSKTVIYVGGVTELYGFDTLMNSMELVAQRFNDFRLIVVCREKEWNRISDKYKNKEWLEIHHTSGAGLEELYRRASVGVMTKQNNRYNEMAVSVKLFEYISFGIPVISTHSEATDRIIQDNKLGLTVDNNAAAIAEGVEYLLTDKEMYEKVRNDVKEALLDSCLWSHRVEQVIRDLLQTAK